MFYRQVDDNATTSGAGATGFTGPSPPKVGPFKDWPGFGIKKTKSADHHNYSYDTERTIPESEYKVSNKFGKFKQHCKILEMLYSFLLDIVRYCNNFFSCSVVTTSTATTPGNLGPNSIAAISTVCKEKPMMIPDNRGILKPHHLRP